MAEIVQFTSKTRLRPPPGLAAARFGKGAMALAPAGTVLFLPCVRKESLKPGAQGRAGTEGPAAPSDQTRIG